MDSSNSGQRFDSISLSQVYFFANWNSAQDIFVGQVSK